MPHHYATTAERVYDAWLDPAQVGQWLFATPTGEMVRVEVDARVGGHFVITERRDGEDVEHLGEYVELVRPTRIAFRVRAPKYSQESTLVTVDIASSESGCELTLTHEMSGDDPAMVEATRQGWEELLDLLEQTLAT